MCASGDASSISSDESQCVTSEQEDHGESATRDKKCQLKVLGCIVINLLSNAT